MQGYFLGASLILLASTASSAVETPSITMPVVASACQLPKSPTIPDGSHATDAQLEDAIIRIKSFQADLMDYRQCLQKEETAFGEALNAAQKDYIAQLYNSSVDTEASIAANFNAQIKIFRETQVVK
ncbi:MAG: hypothetical protein H0W44_04985 [Gammaproteobacteria bacterium]|nr:hypothetical protein [Gammaproteobacteria bacterium]